MGVVRVANMAVLVKSIGDGTLVYGYRMYYIRGIRQVAGSVGEILEVKTHYIGKGLMGKRPAKAKGKTTEEEDSRNTCHA